MKKTISLILSVILLFTALPFTLHAAAETGYASNLNICPSQKTRTQYFKVSEN